MKYVKVVKDPKACGFTGGMFRRHPAINHVGWMFQVIGMTTWYGHESYLLGGLVTGNGLDFRNQVPVESKCLQEVSALEVWAYRLKDRQEIDWSDVNVQEPLTGWDRMEMLKRQMWFVEDCQFAIKKRPADAHMWYALAQDAQDTWSDRAMNKLFLAAWEQACDDHLACPCGCGGLFV